jgi:hypothetical protein
MNCVLTAPLVGQLSVNSPHFATAAWQIGIILADNAPTAGKADEISVMK